MKFRRRRNRIRRRSRGNRQQNANQSHEQHRQEGRGDQPECLGINDDVEGGREEAVDDGADQHDEEAEEEFDDAVFTAYVEDPERSLRTLRRFKDQQDDDHHAGGNKKALICACNYAGTESELRGPINDANTILNLLTTQFNFPNHNLKLLLDNNPNEEMRPTRQNMLDGFEWLLHECQPGDSLFFFFSGHGGHELDETGTEDDGYNETLIPCDASVNGVIVDDTINEMMVNPLPHGVRLHMLIDACFSGSVADLEYRSSVRRNRIRWIDEYIRTPTIHKGTAGGRAYQFGAASDIECALDSHSDSNSFCSGAATFAFVEAIRKHGRDICYGQLLLEMHRSLKKGNEAGSDTEEGTDAEEDEIVFQVTREDVVHRGALCVCSLINLVDHAEASRNWGRQTPVLSCNEEFDLYTPLQL